MFQALALRQVGVLPIRIVKSNVSSVGPSSGPSYVYFTFEYKRYAVEAFKIFIPIGNTNNGNAPCMYNYLVRFGCNKIFD